MPSLAPCPSCPAIGSRTWCNNSASQPWALTVLLIIKPAPLHIDRDLGVKTNHRTSPFTVQDPAVWIGEINPYRARFAPPTALGQLLLLHFLLSFALLDLLQGRLDCRPSFLLVGELGQQLCRLPLVFVSLIGGFRFFEYSLDELIKASLLLL